MNKSSISSIIFAAKAMLQLHVRKRPFVLSHGINARCNMQCKFCDYWKQDISDSSEMSTQEIFDLLDEAYAFGIRIYNAWTTEPLLRKDLPEILRYAKNIGMTTFLITNGKLLESRVDDLNDLDYLSVSVDGISSYEKIRGMEFDSLLDGIKAARQMMKNPILMNCVISRQNLDDIVELVHMARELDVRISFEPLNESESIDRVVWDEIGIRDADLDKYRQVVGRIIEMKKDGYPIINSKTYLKMVRDMKPAYQCHASDMILNVTSDGVIENCRLCREPLGNVTDGIENVWQSSKEKRNEIVKGCDGCLFFGYAEGSLLYDFNTEVMLHYEWM